MFQLRRGDAASRRQRKRRGEQNMVIDEFDDEATTKMVNDNTGEKTLWMGWGDSEFRED